jgi:hypothetical protein
LTKRLVLTSSEKDSNISFGLSLHVVETAFTSVRQLDYEIPDLRDHPMPADIPKDTRVLGDSLR